jgi:hypothetical protein
MRDLIAFGMIGKARARIAGITTEFTEERHEKEAFRQPRQNQTSKYSALKMNLISLLFLSLQAARRWL